MVEMMTQHGIGGRMDTMNHLAQLGGYDHEGPARHMARHASGSTRGVGVDRLRTTYLRRFVALARRRSTGLVRTEDLT